MYNITAAVLLHVVGTQEVEIQYTYYCAYECKRVHVPGTYYIIIRTSKQQTAIAVGMLQQLTVAATACLTLYQV